VIGEGRLVVRLDVADGRVADVSVGFSRPGRVARALAGRAPAEVRTLVPLLFSVCSVAQGVACARALEAALGEPPGPRLDAARDVGCLAEACASHVWQLGLAWRDAAGISPEVPRVARARHALGELCVALFGVPSIAPSLRNDPAWGDARAALDALAALVHELAGSEAPLEAVVRASARASFAIPSHSPLAMLAAPSPEVVAARLAADPTFAEHPELDGHPVEMSAYARHREDETVRAVVSRYGEGLLARLVARRVAALADVEVARARLSEAERAAPGEPPARVAPGEGTGCARTARGPLLHWVRADAARVEELVSVSPTDWTFHPRGVLRSALERTDAGPSLARDTGWLVLALDPCVPWSIEVRDA
jgi:coenzyme F420-reducing hydrogenase alpha subunit